MDRTTGIIATFCEIERPLYSSSLPKKTQETELNMISLRNALLKAKTKKEEQQILWKIANQSCMFNLSDADKPRFKELNERYS